MAKEKSNEKLKETKSKRKSKSERTIEEPKVELSNDSDEMLKQIESPEQSSNKNGINVTYKRPLRKF